MTVEPSQAYTVCIRSVLPPKPEPKPLKPMPSMWEEAKQVRARFRKKWGCLTSQSTSQEHNANQQKRAEARRNELAARALTILAEREMTSGQMQDEFCVSETQMRNALGWIRAQGLATFYRKGSLVMWRLI